MKNSLTLTIHLTAAVLAPIIIAFFLSSSLWVELNGGSIDEIQDVKNQIVCGLLLLIPALIVLGASGHRLNKAFPTTAGALKQQRMKWIALNGILILVPCALYLASKANAEEIDGWFWTVQLAEYAAGCINLILIGRNAMEGKRMKASRMDKLSANS